MKVTSPCSVLRKKRDVPLLTENLWLDNRIHKSVTICAKITFCKISFHISRTFCPSSSSVGTLFSPVGFICLGCFCLGSLLGCFCVFLQYVYKTKSNICFSMLDAFSISEEKVSKRGRPQDLFGCFTHRLLRRYGTQRDHGYARTADLFVLSSTLA